MLDRQEHQGKGGRDPHISTKSVSFVGPPRSFSHPQIDGKTRQYLHGVFRFLSVLSPPRTYC